MHAVKVRRQIKKVLVKFCYVITCGNSLVYIHRSKEQEVEVSGML